MSTTDSAAFERDTLARVSRRCIPLLLLAYIIAFIDRVNIGFAAITASKDLGMSDTVFGAGAGIFFISYFIFEVPSNYVLEQVGARKWLARIMVTCGIVAGAMVFIKGTMSFFAVRFVLGAVEAGLFPGVVLYLTYWFPKRQRARYVSMFAVGIPMASVIGSPVSGMILNLDGVLGVKGWQWLYVLEAFPAVIVGVLIWFFLTDQPRDARWLSAEQRQWLQQTMDAERAAHPDKSRKKNLLQSLRLLADKRVIVLSLVFFGTGMPSYALSFWTPRIVHGFGFGNVATGLVSAIPFVCGSIAMILWARHSDRSRERDWHTASAAILGSAGMTACFFLTSPLITVIALSFSAIGVFGLKGPFLSAVSESFSKETAAVGIAMIVSIGNLSGAASQPLIGFIKQHFGTYPPGLLAVGLCSLFGGLLMFFRPATERANA